LKINQWDLSFINQSMRFEFHQSINEIWVSSINEWDLSFNQWMNEIWVSSINEWDLSFNQWMNEIWVSINEWDLSFNQWMNEIWVSNNDTTWFVCVVNISDLTCILKYISSSNIFEV